MKKEFHRHKCFGYQSKEKHKFYVSKICCEEKHVDLLLTGEEGKRHYILMYDYKLMNTIMCEHYHYTLHHGKKIFLLLLLTSF